MTAERFTEQKFAGSSPLKSLGGRAIGFDLGHF